MTLLRIFSRTKLLELLLQKQHFRVTQIEKLKKERLVITLLQLILTMKQQEQKLPKKTTRIGLMYLMEILTQKDLIEKLLKILSTVLQKHMTPLKKLLTSLQKMMIFIRLLKKLLQQKPLRKSLKQNQIEQRLLKLIMPLQ